MKISEHTISALGSIISGDGGMSRYRSGPELVNFFNQFGLNEEYGRSFPSRWAYAEDKLRELNDTYQMSNVALSAVDPRHYLGTEFDVLKAIEHVNQFLEYDNHVVVQNGRRWILKKLSAPDINLEHPYNESKEITHIFIDEQIEKCNNKLVNDDYDGAITNARSLIEAVLSSIEADFDSMPQKYDGDLPKLYKRVQKHLKLSPGEEGLANNLRQILSGLTSIVSGLASLRNSMGDAHVIKYKPSEHHARLAVNAAKTLCKFLFDTKEYQSPKNA